VSGPAEGDLAAVRRGFELFNAGDLDTLFAEVFDPEVDYRGDPQITALTGTPRNGHGAETVRDLWAAFFAMFDEVRLNDIDLTYHGQGRVTGTCHMVARGEASQVPIDSVFHFAWAIQNNRWRFMAAKLDEAETKKALSDWEQGLATSD
jgi:ketosteroid isomerase-like protein